MSTMSDRELLELAAKAYWPKDEASTRYDEKEGGLLYIHADNQDHNGHDREYVWDPINDDGDALRLAVKLQMQVTIYIVCADASLYGKDNVRENSHDQYAATRRAIVRAAAERGKAMP